MDFGLHAAPVDAFFLSDIGGAGVQLLSDIVFFDQRFKFL